MEFSWLDRAECGEQCGHELFEVPESVASRPEQQGCEWPFGESLLVAEVTIRRDERVARKRYRVEERPLSRSDQCS